jgi:microcompartment protein CcmL/EutN
VATLNSIGLIEVASVATGYLAQDAMLKAADVQLLLARTICSGKYLIVIGGEVAPVSAAVEAGAGRCDGSLIEKRVITHVHPDVFPAIGMSVEIPPDRALALGVIETFSASSIIDVADACAKSADVTLLRIHLAMALGGKGFVLTGDIERRYGRRGRCPGRRRRRHSRRPRGHRRAVEGLFREFM